MSTKKDVSSKDLLAKLNNNKTFIENQSDMNKLKSKSIREEGSDYFKGITEKSKVINFRIKPETDRAITLGLNKRGYLNGDKSRLIREIVFKAFIEMGIITEDDI